LCFILLALTGRLSCARGAAEGGDRTVSSVRAPDPCNFAPGRLFHPPECGCENDSHAKRPRQQNGLALHRVRLLLGQIADHRQLVHLALIRLHEQDNPDYEAPKADQQVQGESDQSQKGHEGEYRKSNVQNK